MMRSSFLLCLLLTWATQLRAQNVQPLSADPGRAAPVGNTSRPVARGTSVTLPFFDDFAQQPEGMPNAEHWEPRGGTLVNNRFPVAPPSRNVVTFDGLKANGQPYGSSSFYSDTDTLTSLPIDLSGLTAGSNVYLSFFWQAGSIVSPPSAASSTRQVAFTLEFLNEAGQWQSIWSQRSTGRRTDFAQEIVAVNDAQYLHANFRFRFHSIGNQANTRDAWSLDYLKLDRNRSAADTTYRDIATSAPLTSLLKRYASMPAVQLAAAPIPADELNDQTGTTINNFDIGPAPTPITWRGTAQNLPKGPELQFLTGNRSIDASARQVPITGDVRTVAAALLTGGPQRIRHRILLGTNETDPRTQPNDSISRVTELSDYYAYDDGTAEAAVSLPALTGGASTFFAYRIDLNQPDQVRSVRLYPVLPNAAGRAITLSVWADVNGKPAEKPLASVPFTVPATAPAGGFLEIPFTQPVGVSGTFYVGYGQASAGQFVQFGLDLNSSPPANYFFYQVRNEWSAVADFSGALMLRPVMTGTVTAATPSRAAALLTLYPNPSSGIVQVKGRYTHATVLDALGRTVWQQTSQTNGQPTLDLSGLPAGVYLMRLALPDGSVAAKRLVLTR
ncbi:T9SS type A sorting domain-containing protein [Hymenobacter sp. DG25A]|uniref:T9SS type A sorting domain-containing protein n=1 Tax=Hymenobacter sp. DG25A TaxID=1385663 RepID=UPI000A467CCA|nr:T9SS type A sorting domain-containing protein [Hymenobacter sp. DG25A]